jgi:hypothetical protein
MRSRFTRRPSATQSAAAPRFTRFLICLCLLLGCRIGPAWAADVTGNLKLSPRAVASSPKLDQTLSFGSQANQFYRPGGSFALSPRAAASSPNSGNPITYTSSPPAICSIIGEIVSMLGAGFCEVTANLAGNELYNPAPQVKQTITILRGNQSIAISTRAELKVNEIVPVNASSLGANSGNPLVLATTTPGVCSISSNGTLTALAVGNCVVTLNQAGDANWNPAQVSTTIPITKRDQQIVFGMQSDQTYRPSGSFALSPPAVATGIVSGNPIVYASSTPSVCSIGNGANITILAAGVCVITADLAGDAAFNPAPQVVQRINVLRGTQTLSATEPTPIRVGELAAVQVGSATPNSGNAVTLVNTTPALCSLSGTRVTALAVGACTITATQAGDGNWNAAASITVTVNIDALRNFSGNTVTGTGLASANVSGGGPRCTMVPNETAFVNATVAYPAGGSFPHGWFRLKLKDCSPGSTVRVTVSWPSALAGLYYLKYGPTPSTPNASSFYSPAALEFSGNSVSFDVTDGGLGDDDLTANGILLDPSGPLLLDLNRAEPIPTLHSWLIAALSMLLVCVGVLFAFGARKRRMLGD